MSKRHLPLHWQYTTTDVKNILARSKEFVPDRNPEFKKSEKANTRKLISDVNFEKRSTLYLSMKYKVSGSPECTESYASAFIVDGRRVRGIDFSAVERKERYVTTIPKGWHENVIDPTYPETDHKRGNRHEPLPENFAPSDLAQFHKACAGRWNIKLENGAELF